MDFAFLIVGAFIGFTLGCLFTIWWHAPSEMDRR